MGVPLAAASSGRVQVLELLGIRSVVALVFMNDAAEGQARVSDSWTSGALNRTG